MDSLSQCCRETIHFLHSVYHPQILSSWAIWMDSWGFATRLADSFPLQSWNTFSIITEWSLFLYYVDIIYNSHYYLFSHYYSSWYIGISLATYFFYDNRISNFKSITDIFTKILKRRSVPDIQRLRLRRNKFIIIFVVSTNGIQVICGKPFSVYHVVLVYYSAIQ